jgi:hypothetical protein
MGRKIKAFARLLEEASTVSTTLLRAQPSNPEMHPRRDSGLLRRISAKLLRNFVASCSQ